MADAKRIDRFPAGVVTLPPSKSLSHRAAICAGLAALCGAADGSTVRNLGASQDIGATLACMQALGAVYSRAGDVLTVPAITQLSSHEKNAAAPLGKETGPTAPPLHIRPTAPLDCGESGSTLRFLLPVAALAGVPVTFTGRGRLMQRPLAVYADVFQQAGVRFTQAANSAQVQGPLPGGNYTLPGNVSSQFLSGLLLALPLAAQSSTLWLSTPLESADYVSMTLDVMAHFGVQARQVDAQTYHIPGGQQYRPAQYTVEGDYSQAAFFLAAGALGRPVACAGLAPHSSQGDAAILDILTQMGITIQQKGNTFTTLPARPRAITLDVRQIPDLVPPLAALCCFGQGTSTLTGAGRLRLKESDRLLALATQLHALGAEIEAGEDSLTICGKPALPGGRADAMGDHRIAMAVAVAAIGCTGPVQLTGWQHVEKSYPAFWADFMKEAQHG